MFAANPWNSNPWSGIYESRAQNMSREGCGARYIAQYALLKERMAGAPLPAGCDTLYQAVHRAVIALQRHWCNCDKVSAVGVVGVHAETQTSCIFVEIDEVLLRVIQYIEQILGE